MTTDPMNTTPTPTEVLRETANDLADWLGSSDLMADEISDHGIDVILRWLRERAGQVEREANLNREQGSLREWLAELAEAKAEIERLRAECYRAWDVAVEERLRRLEAQAGIESPPEPEPDPLAGRLPAPAVNAGPLRVEYGLVWDDLGSADTFPTLEQARAAARGFDEPAQVVRIETWPVADEGRA